MAYWDLTVHSNWNYGIWVHAMCSIRVTKLRAVDNMVGVLLSPVGPPPLTHTYNPALHWRVQDALIVGSVLAACDTPQPLRVDNWAQSNAEAHVGIMVGNFAGGVNNMIPKKKPWHRVQASYPTLHGSGYVNDVVFADFQTDLCLRVHRVLSTNIGNPDAVHPTYFSNVKNVGVHKKNLVRFLNPNPSWVAIDDCVSMDCDGLKHAMLHDLDGSLLGIPKSSVIARAEYSSPNAHGFVAPQKFLTAFDGTMQQESDMIHQYGIVRRGCALNTDWNSWLCTQTNPSVHRMLILESLDGDSEERSLVPVALSHNFTTGTCLVRMVQNTDSGVFQIS